MYHLRTRLLLDDRDLLARPSICLLYEAFQFYTLEPEAKNFRDLIRFGRHLQGRKKDSLKQPDQVRRGLDGTTPRLTEFLVVQLPEPWKQSPRLYMVGGRSLHTRLYWRPIVFDGNGNI